MELTKTLEEKFAEYLAKNAAKRAELEAIAAPYKKLIAEIESEIKTLAEDARLIDCGNHGPRLSPLYWRKSTHILYSNNALNYWYTLQYKNHNQYHDHVSVRIEERPELKKYKYTVTTTAANRWSNGAITIFEQSFNDRMTDKERKYFKYKHTSEASEAEKILLVERWQCKTLEEAEAKAAELMQAINSTLRHTKYYTHLVEMVSAEIDQLETVEIIPA